MLLMATGRHVSGSYITPLPLNRYTISETKHPPGTIYVNDEQAMMHDREESPW